MHEKQTDRTDSTSRPLFAPDYWFVSWHKAVVWGAELMIASTPGSISSTKLAFCIVASISERLWKKKCKLLIRFIWNSCPEGPVVRFPADCERSVVPVWHTSSSQKRLVRQLHCLSNGARWLLKIIIFWLVGMFQQQYTIIFICLNPTLTVYYLTTTCLIIKCSLEK